MKKRLVFILFVLLAVSSFCFADGFDIGTSVRTTLVAGETNIAIGLNTAGSVYFNNFIGIGIFGNISMTLALIRLPLIADALVGPVVRIVNTRYFTLPLAIGVYGYYPLSFQDIPDRKGFKPNIGAGMNIAAQINLGRVVHLYLRVQGAYGFLNGGEFIVNPSFGVGFDGTR